MGKKGNWFSALKRAFTSSSKENITYSSEKKYAKEKKWPGLGKLNHGEVNSFISLYREPSSIEKILGDAEREQQHKICYQDTPKIVQHFNSSNEESSSRKKIQRFQEPCQETHKKVQHLKEPKTKAKPKLTVAECRRAVDPRYAQSSAIKIQAAYRGYMARKSYRTLKGLMRLQKAMRGQSVKRQTTNTMRCMQLFVRVQSQVRERRLQMIQSLNCQKEYQTPQRSEKEMENSFSVWNPTPQSETEADEVWDDSVLTKAEEDTRMRRKVEAVVKRERALAYAYSHQLLKVTPKSAHAVLTNIRSGGSPWWWSWLDRQLPTEPHPTPRPKTPTILTPKFASHAPSATNLQPMINIPDTPTPRFSKPLPSPRTKNSLKPSSKWQQTQSSDKSLTSCPAFRPVPNYMQPTVSAKAKARDDNEGDGKEKKRFSFSLTQSVGSLRWGSKWNLSVAYKENVQDQRVVLKGKHRLTDSIDSTVSLPVGVGRKPFK